MANPKIPRPKPPRPIVTEADYADRGKRQSKRDAKQYQEAREAQAARGEANRWKWVPAVHADLIREVVAAICVDLAKGRTPQQILSFTDDFSTLANPDTLSAAVDRNAAAHRNAPVDLSAGVGVGADQADSLDAQDDSALGQETGRKTGRAAQSREAAKRKKAAGVKRVCLVVPERFKPAVSDLLDQILDALAADQRPAIIPVDPPHDETRIAGQQEPQPHLSAPAATRPAAAPSLGREGDAAAANDNAVPDACPEAALQTPSPAHPQTSPPQEITGSWAEPRRSGAPCPADSAEEKRDQLFFEIHALYGRSGP